MAQPGAQAAGARSGRVEGKPTRTVVDLSQTLGRDGHYLVFVDAAEPGHGVLPPHPPGPSSLSHQPVEDHALVDLDEGDVALARRSTLEPHAVARLEQWPHGEPAGADLDRAALEGVLEAPPRRRGLGAQGSTAPAAG